MRNDPFRDLGEKSSGRTMFDYDIESDRYACFLRWFTGKFVWWFFGPLALIGILFAIWCLLFERVPHGVDRAVIEQQKTEETIKECEHYFKY